MYNHHLDNKDYMILLMLNEGSPSIIELKTAIMARSTGTVAYRLEKMQEMGLIIQPVKNQTRSRTITQLGKEQLHTAGLIKNA